MPPISQSIIALADSLEQRWNNYRSGGTSDAFVEFTLALNGLTEQITRLHMLGLVRACQELENTALALFGDSSMHPISREQANAIARQVDVILGELKRQNTPASQIRRKADTPERTGESWDRPRKVLIISRDNHPWTSALSEQLAFFGFTPENINWHEQPLADDPLLAIVFIPDSEGSPYSAANISVVANLRGNYPTSFFYCVSVPTNLECIVELQRAGADACVPMGNKVSDVISRILDLVATAEQEVHRVLIVEDSATAIAHIQRSLNQHGIDSRAIRDPRAILEAAAEYHPDAILMDMYMPYCTGVEVTKALRQVPEYQALPVIYLSSETDMAQQVEALRLGGDQFLNKPANPIVLASVVKTKIKRYREMLHAGQHDSLTGLFNHSSSKIEIERMLYAASSDRPLVIAMLDIDRFKSINDNYGHPVGDQVIRSIAWLLRGRLRNSDLVGRYGGEEFILALPGIGIDRACELIDKIREDFSIMPHAHALGSLRASFSCGVATFPDYQSTSALIEAADNALLKAKRDGRNRVLKAGPADHTSVV